MTTASREGGRLKAASCFSGIGAPELGGPQFDWLWHAEIEKFPAAVMEARFPGSTNLGDVTADDFLQRASAFGRLDPNEMTFVAVAPTLDANYGSLHGHDNQHIDGGAGMFIAHSLRGEGFDASEDGTGRGTPIVPVQFCEQEIAGTMMAYAKSGSDTNRIDRAASGYMVPVAFSHQTPAVATAWQVRRLTTTECERLQSFPDGFTDITYRGKPAADGPRYKALGNSWARVNGEWIIARIAQHQEAA